MAQAQPFRSRSPTLACYPCPKSALHRLHIATPTRQQTLCATSGASWRCTMRRLTARCARRWSRPSSCCATGTRSCEEFLRLHVIATGVSYVLCNWLNPSFFHFYAEEICETDQMKRPKPQVSAMELLPLFFRLFRCQDKGLRQMVFRHVIAGQTTNLPRFLMPSL